MLIAEFRQHISPASRRAGCRHFSTDIPLNNPEPSSPVADWVREHGQELVAFLARRLNCRNAAADLAQETYTRLHAYADEAAIDNVGAFAFRVAANLAVDYQRKAATRERFHRDATEWEELAVADAKARLPEEILLHRERLERLREAMEELPEDCRRAFYLNRVEGYTHEEVARRIGISESMVGKHLARALRHCRARLQDA